MPPTELRTRRRPSRDGRRVRAPLSLPAAALLLAGCVYVPRTTTVYDADCHVSARQMDLQPVQVAALAGCRGGNECSALLVAAGATAAVSAVISGSIVVVGNVAYWFEKQGRCRRDD